MKKGGQKPHAGIKNATENFFLCTISGFYNKGRKKSDIPFKDWWLHKTDFDL